MSSVPVYVNVRDRLRDLRSLVAWLERAGHERIVLVDNASTYEPLLDYLVGTPHRVVRLGRNMGARSLFNAGLVPDEFFVYADPDCVPIVECPHGAVAILKETLERFRDWPKAGLGLYLADLPGDHYALDWERSLIGIPSARFPRPIGRELAPGVYGSMVDTTFALYRPNAKFTADYRAIRLGWPYLCRHMPWYVTDVGDEDRYYLDHATGGPCGSSWADHVKNGGPRG